MSEATPNPASSNGHAPWVVLKFGGTSVSTRARWETIAAVVQARRAEGLTPFVVCSAVSGVSRMLDAIVERAPAGEHGPLIEEVRERHRTLAAELGLGADALLGDLFEHLDRLALGASLTNEVSPRLHARILAVGELLSTTLGAAFLEAQGLGTRWLDAREHLRATDAPGGTAQRRFLAATCEHAPDAALQRALAEAPAEAVLTQGFIGATPEGDTVLLGWGGSDTSAAYFASKLQAQRLEIWTDVPGLFTANPRQIPSARLLRHLTYDEAEELATMGAKVLHPRCIDPVRQAGIPLHVRSTEAPEMEGTVVDADAPDADARVKAVSVRTGVTLISMDTVGMWQTVGFLADVFEVFRRHELSIGLVATSETNVTVSLDPTINEVDDPHTIDSLLRGLSAYCGARQIGPCGAVSLVGRHIRSILHEISPAFEVFEEHHVHLVTQAASDLNLTFVVDEEQAARLLRSLHAGLFGEREPDATFGPTWRELHAAPEPPAPTWWRRRRGDLLELAETHAPCYVYDAETLRERAEAVRSIEAVDRVFYAMKANDHPDVLRIFRAAGLGFECVSPGEVGRVQELFPGLPADELLFTPNFAPRADYASGFAAGAHITLDNLYPIEAWPELFEGRDLIIRMDPGRGHGHHKHVRTAGAQSKFGVWPGELPRLRELVERVGARVVGFHAHVGSGIRRASTWAQTAVFLASLREGFPDLRLLNLGGGLGVVERPGTPPLETDALAERLATFKRAHPDLELWLEPGRFLVATAGALLARVTQLKEKGAVRYVGAETGMNSLIRPALYGAFHEIVNLTRLDEPPAITAEVVGPICESGDVLGHGRRLPETREGDVLLIATAGAYGRVMASRYNLRAPAAELVLPAGEPVSSEG